MCVMHLTSCAALDLVILFGCMIFHELVAIPIVRGGSAENIMMPRLLSCTVGIALAFFIFSVEGTAFVVPCSLPRIVSRFRPIGTALPPTKTALEASDNTADVDIDAPVVAVEGGVDVTIKSEPCEGYPNCDGAYRDKGCDGSGRIPGGVGAVLPWFPVKAFRPCPSFTAAKYRYDRSGQSLNEVMFAGKKKNRKAQGTAAADTTADMDDSADDDV